MPKRNMKRRLASRRKPKPPPLPDMSLVRESDEEEEEEEEEEDEYLQQGLTEGRLGFLTKMKAEDLLKPTSKKDEGKISAVEGSGVSPSRKRRRQRDDAESDGGEREAEFERRPRLAGWRRGEMEEEGVHHLLPLKGHRGELISQPTVPRPPGSQENAESSSDDEEDEAEEDLEGLKSDQDRGELSEAVPASLTTAALLAQRAQKLTEKKESIAAMASQLIESPEENVDQLKQLHSLCMERDPEVAITVRKLAMTSLVAVFRDIVPSYRIRELTAEEKAVKVSRDVRRLRHFEQSLLASYQQFLDLLDETIRVGLVTGGHGDRDKKGPPRKRQRKERKEREGKVSITELEDGQQLSPESIASLVEVGLHCLSTLLTSLSHFNFRKNLIVALVPLMNSRALGGKVSQMCCAAIERLFEVDSVGEVSLEAVQIIGKMVKSKNYKTKPAVLRTFLHLQISHVEETVGAMGTPWEGGGMMNKDERKRELREKLTKMTKKQKKRFKMERKLDRELKQTEATESREKKSKVQTEVLKIVFLTYFRILKHTRHSPLLRPVLEGLAKFAHLINVDFFQDLMSVLHSVAEMGELSNKECMQCVLTAFEILSGQGAALNIDPRQFYQQLYEAILQLDACSTNEDIVLAVRCLDKMLRRRRQVSLQRVLGFVKRLSTVTLQLFPEACLAVMATIKQFMHSYSQCEQLLDAESSAGGGGVYCPASPDPEMSHADSAVQWELSLLSRHYDPSLRAYASHLLIGAPSQGKGTLHPDLARRSSKDFLKVSQLDNSPMSGVPSPPSHPAVKMAEKKGKQHKQYFYKDAGLISEELAQAQEEAWQLAGEGLLRLESSLLS